MSFNPNASLDPSQVEDVRGRSYGGGRGLAIGGGSIGLVLTLLYVLLGGNLSDVTGGGQPVDYGPNASAPNLAEVCKTGADANSREDCRILGYVNSVQAFWKDEFARSNAQYQTAKTTLFSGQVDTGCGTASTQVGPFYCPTDQTIYLDTTFFDDVLEGQLGGKGGDFVEPYVLAHEFGHHIQNLLGTMGRVRTQSGPTSDSVRLELQADCYAGMWTRGATGTTDQSGVQIFESIDEGDITEALDAAKSVGDDRIQKQGGGDVNKEQWTHGSSEERMRWFTTGYNATGIKQCDTFSTNNL